MLFSCCIPVPIARRFASPMLAGSDVGLTGIPFRYFYRVLRDDQAEVKNLLK